MHLIKLDNLDILDPISRSLVDEIRRLGGLSLEINTSHMEMPETIIPDTVIPWRAQESIATVHANIEVYGIVRYWDIKCQDPIYGVKSKRLGTASRDLHIALHDMIDAIKAHNEKSKKLWKEFSPECHLLRMEAQRNVNSSNTPCGSIEQAD
ncbi:MAG: hypothetical protein NC548_05890 [Lachnospiraceae bacterium]|nr:hypothetical protein [Lachnospiraceae bacterium]